MLVKDKCRKTCLTFLPTRAALGSPAVGTDIPCACTKVHQRPEPGSGSGKRQRAAKAVRRSTPGVQPAPRTEVRPTTYGKKINQSDEERQQLKRWVIKKGSVGLCLLSRTPLTPRSRASRRPLRALWRRRGSGTLRASSPPATAAVPHPPCALSHTVSHSTPPPPKSPHTGTGRAHRPRLPRPPYAPRTGPGVRRGAGGGKRERPAGRTDAAGTQCAQAPPPRREGRDPRLGPMRPRPERDFLRGSRGGEPRRSGGDT